MFSTVSSAAVDTSVTLSDSRLEIDHLGTQDHQANRIVNSQTVNDLHRTAEPSLRFDGVDDYVKVEGIDPTAFTTITVSAWVKIKAKTAWGAIAIQADDNNFHKGWGLQFIESTDNLIFWVDDYDPTRASADVSAHYGKWLHVVGTYDGTDQKLYFNGVEVDSEAETWTQKGAATNEIHIGAGVGANNATPNYYLNGEIKDFHIHNRALEDTEVAAAYNGESTPWKYADAGGELVTGGDMENASDLGTGYGVNLTQSSTVAHTGTYSAKLVDGGGSSAKTAKGFTAEAGKTYRVSGWYYPTSDMGNARLLVRDSSSWGTDIADTAGSNFTNINVSGITANQWNYVSAEWTATTTYNGALYASWCVGDDANDQGTAYWDDVSVVAVGEVAAYTPQSIDKSFDRWHDTVGSNTGTISGATLVGDTDHYGRFVVKGSSELTWNNTNSTLTETDAFEAPAGSIQVGGLETVCGRLDYTPTSTTHLTLDNTYDAATSKTSFGMRSAGTRLSCLEITGDGSVKATSGTSTNLKQVARVHSEDFVLGASDTNKVITHNLGTADVVISVRVNPAQTPTDGYAHVEVFTKIGNAANENTSNNVTLYWATAPTEKNYTVTVIG